MNTKLFLAGIYVPFFYRKARLSELGRITAEAFGISDRVFSARGRFDDMLVEYANFTRDEAYKALADDSQVKLVRERLFNNAYEMGCRLRHELNIKNIHEARLATKLIYKAIRIDFDWREDGTAFVRRCFFSKYYGGEVCKVISSLDAGLIAGLSGGYKLSFTHRITENSPYCKAMITV